MSKQLAFKIKTHGGSRRGAGRPRARLHDPAHTARPQLNSRTPSHVTLRFVEEVPNLRSEAFLNEFTRAIEKAKAKGLAVSQFAIESNHIHLLIEVADNDTLTRGLLSLQGSITWGLRRAFRYFGSVFAGRFHLHPLASPREMKNALAYVLFNHAKHCKVEWFADVFSSAFAFGELHWFVGRTTRPPKWQAQIDRSLTPARSWLQKLGWKRAR